MLRPTRLWIRAGWQPLAQDALNRLAEIGVAEVLEVGKKLGIMKITVRPQPALTTQSDHSWLRPLGDRRRSATCAGLRASYEQARGAGLGVTSTPKFKTHEVQRTAVATASPLREEA